MSQKQIFETGHSGSVVDASAHEAGRLLATAGADREIRIVDVSKEPSCIAVLNGHEDQLIGVSWAPARLSGNALMSFGADKKLNVWKETSANEWSVAYTRTFSADLMCVRWAPAEYGEMLACCCSDGKVHILAKQNDWVVQSFAAHPNAGCSGISWAPALPPSALMALPVSKQQLQQNSLSMPLPRVVTCGGERSVRIWRYMPQDSQWIQEHELTDVAARAMVCVTWAANQGAPFTYIAGSSEEGVVGIWYQDGMDGRWQFCQLPIASTEPIVRLEWSPVGTFLSTVSESGSTTLWKEAASGAWESVSSLS